jgi:hypothetical protein
MTGRVRSPLIGASSHSALLVRFSTVTFNRRVQSRRPARPVSAYFAELAVIVRFDYEVYKYIPFTSFKGLLPICSAEKDLLSARKCKSSSEGNV